MYRFIVPIIIRPLAFLFFFIVPVLSVIAQPPTYTWAKGYGGIESEFGESVAVSSTTNNIYVAGTFSGTNVDFDPSANTFYLSAAGSGYDIYVAKFAPSGAFIWAFKIGGSSTNDLVGQLVLGANDTIYLAGAFRGTADFNPGAASNSFSCTGGIYSDPFIATYDMNGNYINAKVLTGSGEDQIRSMQLNNGYLYVTGRFESTLDFDPTANTSTLSASGADMFLAKYPSNLSSLAWAKKIGGIYTDEGRSLAVDNSGNAYITGNYRGTNIDFDPGPNQMNLSSVNTTTDDIFICKFTSAGNLSWAQTLGGSSSDQSVTIDLDPDQNPIVCGNFFGTNIDFDPGPSVTLLSSAGNADFFIGKYASSTGYLNGWAFKIGAGSWGSYSDIVNSMFVDHLGNIFVTGYFDSGSPDFDPNAGVTTLSAPSATYDVFFAKYFNNGTLAWAKNMGGNGYEQGYDICVDADNYVYLTGYFGTNPMDFDPNSGTANVYRFAQSDAFIAKYADVGTSILPVELISFSADADCFEKEIRWETASETNNDFFILEKSTDGIDFYELTRMDGAGNSNLPRSYQYTDRQVGDENNYYRLKQTDVNGDFHYSQIIPVHSVSDDCIELLAFPNPFSNQLQIYFSNQNISLINISDLLGKEIFSVADPETSIIDFSTGTWSPGMYLISVVTKNNQTKTLKIIKN